MRFTAGPMLKRSSYGFGKLTSRATGNAASLAACVVIVAAQD